jgi:hypothetical protein
MWLGLDNLNTFDPLSKLGKKRADQQPRVVNAKAIMRASAVRHMRVGHAFESDFMRFIEDACIKIR